MLEKDSLSNPEKDWSIEQWREITQDWGEVQKLLANTAREKPLDERRRLGSEFFEERINFEDEDHFIEWASIICGMSDETLDRVIASFPPPPTEEEFQEGAKLINMIRAKNLAAIKQNSEPQEVQFGIDFHPFQKAQIFDEAIPLFEPQFYTPICLNGLRGGVGAYALPHNPRLLIIAVDFEANLPQDFLRIPAVGVTMGYKTHRDTVSFANFGLERELGFAPCFFENGVTLFQRLMTHQSRGKERISAFKLKPKTLRDRIILNIDSGTDSHIRVPYF